MPNFELVHEILNHCPNNQMRDIFFQEVETDDPEGYVRAFLKKTELQVQTETLADGSIRVLASCDGLNHRFLFTAD